MHSAGTTVGKCFGVPMLKDCILPSSHRECHLLLIVLSLRMSAIDLNYLGDLIGEVKAGAAAPIPLGDITRTQLMPC